MALTVNQKIANFANGNIGKQVGNGECWTFAEQALVSAGGQTSRDLMGDAAITDDADYVWGDAIAVKDLNPGDILQLRDYVMTTTTVVSVLYTNLPKGVEIDENPIEESSDSVTLSLPHHTAIVTSKYSNSGVKVLHQNVEPKGKVVQKGRLALSQVAPVKKVTHESRELDVNDKSIRVPVKVTTTTAVAVSGTIWHTTRARTDEHASRRPSRDSTRRRVRAACRPERRPTGHPETPDTRQQLRLRHYAQTLQRRMAPHPIPTRIRLRLGPRPPACCMLVKRTGTLGTSSDRFAPGMRLFASLPRRGVKRSAGSTPNAA